jgi:nucleoside-diphosphate-sugar epimerase
MTRVLITGGAGRVGRAVTARFVEHGWDVRVIGIIPDVKIEGAEYVLCDIEDYPKLREQVRGCQAIVHLAAIPSPTIMPSPDMYRINTAGTYNVFEAADAEGVGRVVQASSINAVGCAWGNTDLEVKYLPIDEEHPSFTTDPYSFSKKVVEDIGEYYWRRSGITSVGLRWPAVYPPEHLSSKAFLQDRDQMQYLLNTFAQMDEQERAARIEAVRKKVLDFRAARGMEYPNKEGWKGPDDDWLVRAYHGGRFNYWAYIDDRDAAQATEKALTADYEGSHPLFINNDHNSVGYSSQKLAELFFPGIPIKGELKDADTLVSIEKAKNLIGFKPEYHLAE